MPARRFDSEDRCQCIGTKFYLKETDGLLCHAWLCLDDEQTSKKSELINFMDILLCLNLGAAEVPAEEALENMSSMLRGRHVKYLMLPSSEKVATTTAPAR
eukprot:6479399-Amphidinium_carterae.2